jgi:ribosomal protein S18 acetylase RimI-like enzyme
LWTFAIRYDAWVSASLDGLLRFDEERSTFLLEHAGRCLARMEFLGDPPHDVLLVHPRCEADVEPVHAAQRLVDAGVRRAREAGCVRIGLVLEDRLPNTAAFVAAAGTAWGFDFDADKVLVRAKSDALRLDCLTAAPPDAAFVPHDPDLVAVFQRVLASSLTRSDRETDAARELASFEARSRGDGGFHPEDWVVLRISGVAAGLVIPAFLDARRDGGTLFYLGVLPEFRGRSLGEVLTRRGVEAMLTRGVTRYADSCNVANVPMRRIFEKLGCGVVTTQHLFDRRLI